MKDRIASWLHRNESYIVPAWIKLVRFRGGERDRSFTTRELERQFFSDFYHSFVHAVESGNLDRMGQVLERIASTRVEEEFQLGETLDIFVLLKELLWERIDDAHSAETLLTWRQSIEPVFDGCFRLLGQAFTRASHALLSERLIEAEFMTRRLAIATEEADRALSRLRILYNVSRAISSTLDQRQILASVAENLSSVPQIDRCAVWLADGDAHELSVAAAHGIDAARLQGAFLSLEDSHSALVRAFVMRKLQLVASVDDQDEAVGSLFRQRLLLVVPLPGEEWPVGVVTVDRLASDQALETAVVELVQSVVDQAGVALQKARLYEELVELNRHLDQRVQERTEELAHLNRDLGKLNKKKSDFVAIAAHELKTPLTLVQGYAEMLAEAGVYSLPPDVMNRQLAGIIKGVDRLRTIIEDIIDVSLIDTEVLALSIELTSIYHVAEMVCRDWMEVVQERKQRLVLHRFDDLPYIEGDALRLHQVLGNIIGNAIKYTPDGGKIEIMARQIEAQPDRPAFIEVVVADTGVGINPDEQDRIFDKFYRVEGPELHSSSKTRFMGAGPGLGLTIAKGIVEAHGGRIWVESDGCDAVRCPGSQFHVLLPVRSAWGDFQARGDLSAIVPDQVRGSVFDDSSTSLQQTLRT
ncbi:MAG: GAF domain-containing protein [Anaerolineae bacterium]|nr:GAF domain-containing protein [Anaerolineae bacterium]